MGLALLWIAQLSFSLLLVATALAFVGSTSTRTKRLVVASIALAPLIGLHARAAWSAVLLRFDLGAENAPWIFATSLLGAHAAGGLWLTWRAWRGRLELGSLRGRLVLATLAALAVDATTFHVLTLDSRFLGVSLQLEAGRIAYANTAPRAEPVDNAAPRYVELGRELGTSALSAALDEWQAALRDHAAIDAHSPELRSALSRAAATLAEIRAATRLARCAFEPGSEFDMRPIPDVLPLLRMSGLLALDARVRTADGDAVGAIEDVNAMLALSAHLAEVPSLITLLAASVARSSAVDTLAHVLALAPLDAKRLGELSLEAAPLAPRYSAALRMEEAWALSMVGAALATDSGAFVDSTDRLDAVDGALYGVFLAEEDVRGYRTTMAEARELGDVALRDLARAAREHEVTRRSARGRGVLAYLMAADFASRLLELRRGDAYLELAQAALEATRHRIEHGAYPTELGLWSGATPGARVARDGATLVLTHADSDAFQNPPELRLPTDIR